MAGRDEDRLIAWAHEMRAVHGRLREALDVTREALEAGAGAGTVRDLLLYCRGFCTALGGHHDSEDRVLFPAIAAAHPELGETLDRLTQDHSMISYLISGMEKALASGAAPGELERHLDGIGAIMESHFRYEERVLLEVLETLRLDVSVADAFGPL